MDYSKNLGRISFDGDQHFSVGRERPGVEIATHVRLRKQPLTRDGIMKGHLTSIVTGCDHVPVRRVCDTGSRKRIPFVNLLARGRIPNSDTLVVPRGGQGLAVRCKVNAPDPLAMPLSEPPNRLASARLPESDGAFNAGSGDGLPIR